MTNDHSMIKIQRKVKTAGKLWNLWHIDRATERFIAHNRKLWGFQWAAFAKASAGKQGFGGQARPRRASKASAPKEVLCNFDPVCLTHVKFSYLMNTLARQHGAAIKTFSMRTPASQRRLWSVYESFNTSEYVYVRPYPTDYPAVEREVRLILSVVKSKQDLLDLKVCGLSLGVDIYETYLMKCGHPTVDLEDPALVRLIAETVGLVLFWQDYFAIHNVRAIGMSIDGYTANNTVTKVAQAAGVPVYTPDMLAPRIRDVPFAASVAYRDFRRLFANLTKEDQAYGMTRAQEQLSQRMAGEVGVGMSYSMKSAWHKEWWPERIVKDSSRTAVLICAHDFIDAPHSHGGMLFCDFVEWLVWVARIAHETDYDWYIKLHADHDPLSADAVRQIMAAFPRIKLVSASVSHHQLIQEGISAVLTCYGSVGHEYPLFGIPVVNAGYNPHIAYSFNYHPASLDEYRALLLRLPTLKCKGEARDIYEFYYMYHYDELARTPLHWWREMLASVSAEDRARPAIYDVWQQHLTQERHRELVNNMQRVMARRVHHLAEA